MPEDSKLLTEFLPRIIRWHRENRRALPWREQRTPYRVWISEIMLQQTRIEAVIPYYERFLAALPDVRSLAEVSEDTLLKLWEGLGYYSRARNLQKAARQIVREYGGELPGTAEELRRLPGIGDYTAGAIASLAFGQPSPAVDGNVLRVLSRVLGREDDIAAASTKAAWTRELAALYPSGEEAGLLTEGLMELGQRLCLPGPEPDCAACPAAALCRARASGRQGSLPVRTPKAPRRVEERTILLLCCEGRWAVRRRAEKGLLAGLWEFPGLEGSLDGDGAREAAAKLGLEPLDCEDWGRSVHVFTHVEWHMRAYALRCARPGGELCWKTPEELRGETPIPTALRRWQQLIEERGI